MSMPCYSIRQTDPAVNLALEEVLFRRLGPDFAGCFLLWQNGPSVIVGRHQNTREEVDTAWLAERGVPVVRRNTGGGAVYHDLGNLNFSFMEYAPERSRMDFARYLEPVCAALARLGVTARLTGRNDLEAGGRKISGSAQSLRAGRVLHHGTLLVNLDFADMVAALSVNPEKYRSRGVASVRARVTNISEHWDAGSTMEDLREALAACCAPGSVLRDVPPDVLREAEGLAAAKYRTWEWNFGKSPAFSERRRQRFPWGLVDVLLDVRGGRIASCRILGDFFAAADVGELERRLTGVRDEPDALRAALTGVDWESCFSGCEPAAMQNFFTRG
ncbi:lipoate--protein ligase [uncultured Desulfovibrio sp.]|uniref:lipoate--protein ligase n=1 Tax=uncultured Desulfovibrio sp. TaxID=167968 RepID=UPI00262E56E3|nr:lipoate--protein ligase [uncultured Desulfovibrio sp.]